MRRGLALLTVVACVVLWLTSLQWAPFQPHYEPRHDLLQWTYVAAVGYLFATFLVARAVSDRTLVRALALQLALATITVVVFVAYHHHHATGPQPMVQFWDAMEPVTPFHEQLAVPAFVALGVAPLIVALGLRSERRAGRQLTW